MCASSFVVVAAVAVVAVFGVVGVIGAGEAPNGVHLALTETPNTMRAMWSLPSTKATDSLQGYCMFGHSPDALNTQSTVGNAYTYPSGGFAGSLFDVVMENLVDDAVYYYQCGSKDLGFSSTFRFFTPPSRTTTTIHAIVWGDMGVDNPVSSPKYTQASAADEIQKNNFTLIINVGDTSYANDYQPASTNSHIGDQFWNEVQGSAAYAPMMLCPGNHESQFDFAAHLNRTHMPVVASGPLKRFYNSFNYGPVHFATISTENANNNGTEQWQFLQDDLKKAAANRANVPWIVVFTHHPFYCSNLLYKTSRCGKEMDAFLESYEGMFNQYGVDVFMAGHDHMYERSWPVRNRVPIKNLHNPGAPVYIVEGAAGTLEGLNGLVFDVPWRAAHVKGIETGYGRISVNTTAFTYEHVASKDHSVQDSFTLTK